MGTRIELKNANGVGSEIILENPDTNNGDGKIIDVSRINEHLYGPTLNRPSSPSNYQQYFDTTLGIPIWWNTTTWVNSLGTGV